MSLKTKGSILETKVYVYSKNCVEGRVYKEEKLDLKYNYRDTNGHTRDWSWPLPLELKPKFSKDIKGP